MRGPRTAPPPLPPKQVVPRASAPLSSTTSDGWASDDSWLQTLLFLSQWRLRDVHRVYGRLLDQHRLLTATHAHEGDPFRSSSQWFIGLRDFRNVFDVDGRRGRGRSRANRDERAGAPPPASSAVADALFARFRRPNGDADVLEMFSALALLCSTDGLKARVAFVFALFAHVDEAKMEELYSEQRALRTAMQRTMAELVAVECELGALSAATVSDAPGAPPVLVAGDAVAVEILMSAEPSKSGGAAVVEGVVEEKIASPTPAASPPPGPPALPPFERAPGVSDAKRLRELSDKLGSTLSDLRRRCAVLDGEITELSAADGVGNCALQCGWWKENVDIVRYEERVVRAASRLALNEDGFASVRVFVLVLLRTKMIVLFTHFDDVFCIK